MLIFSIVGGGNTLNVNRNFLDNIQMERCGGYVPSLILVSHVQLYHIK